MFVQLHARWRRLYFGQAESPGFRTVFEMAHLKNFPSQYSHLSGLLDVFKAKLVSVALWVTCGDLCDACCSWDGEKRR